MDEDAASYCTGFLALPNETILSISSYLDKLDLAQLRLVCKRTSPLAAKLLFRSITTSFVTLSTLLHVAGSPLGEYVEELVFIEVDSQYAVHRAPPLHVPTRDSERIWRLVNWIRVHHCLPNYDDKASPMEDEDWPVPDELENLAAPIRYWKPNIASHGKCSIKLLA